MLITAAPAAAANTIPQSTIWLLSPVFAEVSFFVSVKEALSPPFGFTAEGSDAVFPVFPLPSFPEVSEPLFPL